MPTDPNDWLLSGGAPSVKFPQIGAHVVGTVVSAEITQQRDLEGNPKTYDDGNPMEQLVVTLQTDERDASIDNDDGKRRLFVKGQMKAAVADAVRKSGSSLQPGGKLAVKYIGDKAPEKRGFSPAKQYQAAYQPGTDPAVDQMLASNATQGEPVAAGVGSGGEDASSLL
jgi:hypothetical protein